MLEAKVVVTTPNVLRSLRNVLRIHMIQDHRVALHIIEISFKACPCVSWLDGACVDHVAVI